MFGVADGLANFNNGSSTPDFQCPRMVRLPSKSVVADIRTLPSSANNRHMQRSKPHSYSITSSAKM